MAPIQFMARPAGSRRTAGGQAPVRIPFFQASAAPSQEPNPFLFPATSEATERAQVVARLPVAQGGGPPAQLHTELTSLAPQLTERSVPAEAGAPHTVSRGQLKAPRAQAPASLSIHFLGGDGAEDLLDWLPPATAAQQPHSTADASWAIPPSLPPIFTGSEQPPTTGSSASRGTLAPATGNISSAAGVAGPLGGGGAADSSYSGQSTFLRAEGQATRALPSLRTAPVDLPHTKSFEFEVLQGSEQGPSSPLSERRASRTRVLCLTAWNAVFSLAVYFRIVFALFSAAMFIWRGLLPAVHGRL